MKLARIFSEHMVLQQGRVFPVWGWADAGTAVTVRLAGQTAQVVAGTDGAWRVTLPALPAGGPHTLSVHGGSETLTVHDVLVGEVWICSGQSNMEWSVAVARDAEAETAASGDDALRMFTVPQRTALTPQATVDGTWAVASPATTGAFSAVGYFFARTLRQTLGVPVGMLHTSWGGTPAEAWTSLEALQAEPELAELVATFNAFADDPDPLARITAATEAWNAQQNMAIPAIADFASTWASPALDDTAWPLMSLPSSWQEAGVEHNGVLWFRLAVDVPASWAGKELTLGIGAVDKSEFTYFNGVQVGSLTHEHNPQSWCTPRRYTIPGNLVHAGRNLIAVRAFSHIYNAGLTGPANKMVLELPGEASISLAGAWRYQVEHDLGNYRTPSAEVGCLQNLSSTLYNAMLAPLVPYGVRGAIWYQGESNVGRAAQYRVLFPAMIRDWRARFGQGDISFLFVQLANFLARNEEPVDSEWAELRETQTQTLALLNTGMAVIIDIGDADDIHPTNKQDVGYRLAQWALAQYYDQQVVASGPLFTNTVREGSAMRISFAYAQGLHAKGGPLTGFAVAGADRKFMWADAHIDGDTVLVSCAHVPVPVAVRYAWADNPVCNLYNAAGLPASPFRSDNWGKG